MFKFSTDVVALSGISKRWSIFEVWESGELLLLFLFLTELLGLFCIEFLLLFNTIDVDDLVDDNDDEFVEEDAGDINRTGLSLFIVVFISLSLFIVEFSL